MCPKDWCARQESNLRPLASEANTLSTELQARKKLHHLKLKHTKKDKIFKDEAIFTLNRHDSTQVRACVNRMLCCIAIICK